MVKDKGTKKSKKGGKKDKEKRQNETVMPLTGIELPFLKKRPVFISNQPEFERINMQTTIPNKSF